jgi:hypothetical protein
MFTDPTFTGTVGGTTDFGGNVSLTGSLSVKGDIMPSAENLYDIGSAAMRWEDMWADQVYGRSVYVDDYIYHNGDANTYIQFQADRQTFVASGSEFIDFKETAQPYITLGNGNDTDTRMQGGAGYIFIQGSDGYIGINDASPSYPFEVNANTFIGATLEVSGITSLLTNVAKTATSNNEYALLGKTSETSGYGALQLLQKGATLVADRIWSLQTIESGVANAGIISLQPSGGTVSIGGNTGINTSTPQKPLHIEGTGAASEMQILVSSASDTVGHTAGIGLRAEGGESDGDLRIKGGIFFEREAGDYGVGKMYFANNGAQSNASVTVADKALTISGSGHIGIGTATPANGKLEVQQTTTDPALWVQTGGTTDAYTIADFRTGTNACALTIKGNGGIVVGSSSDSSQLGSNTKLKVVGDGNVNAGASQGSLFIAAGTTDGDTGLPINMGTAGATLMLMASINTGTGTATNSATYIVRFYFDGNNVPSTTYLGGSSDFVTFGKTVGNTLKLSGSSSGNKSYAWFINKFGV